MSAFTPEVVGLPEAFPTTDAATPVEGAASERPFINVLGLNLTKEEASEVWRNLDFYFAPNWRPILTAPRDGTWVDLWGKAASDQHFTPNAQPRRFALCNFRQISAGPDFDHEWLTANGQRVSPSHWMPLPASPMARLERQDETVQSSGTNNDV